MSCFDEGAYAADFITLLEQLKGAAPDWTWKHKTTAAKDDAGFTVVTLEVRADRHCGPKDVWDVCGISAIQSEWKASQTTIIGGLQPSLENDSIFMQEKYAF